MPKVGVILSGCGFQDGAEIQESVFTLLYLDQSGVEYVCMAPDIEQRKVVNHLTNQEENQKRNVLVESARITRGNITKISEIKSEELDALILPGGFGAALNLSDFALGKESVEINQEVDKIIKEVKSQNKPIGFICIAPALAAKSIGGNVKVTIGNDEGTAKRLIKLGATHENKSVEDITIDLKNKIVSTPAYMIGSGPKEVAKGIEKLVKEVIRLINI